MPNKAEPGSSRFNWMLILGLFFLVFPSIAWLAMFSTVAKIDLLENISRTVLDTLPGAGEIALLAGCPLATAIFGFVAFRRVKGRNGKLEALSLVTIGAGLLYIFMAVLASFRNS